MEADEIMIKLNQKWQLRIICLILAIVLWFVIINEQNPTSEGSYTVPVTVEIPSILQPMSLRWCMYAFKARATRLSM